MKANSWEKQMQPVREAMRRLELSGYPDDGATRRYAKQLKAAAQKLAAAARAAQLRSCTHKQTKVLFTYGDLSRKERCLNCEKLMYRTLEQQGLCPHQMSFSVSCQPCGREVRGA